MEALARRSGIKLDASRIDYELARRGITAARLAEVAGVPGPTLSRARHGRPVTHTTLGRLSKALLEIPLLLGSDLLIAEPEKKIAEGSAASAISVKEASRVRGTTSAGV